MSQDSDRYPVHAPGWAAIDAALERIHRGQVPHQFASQTAYDLESPSPLPAIGVYEARSPDHWHYVTYGLTELFEKSAPQADVSGFGFELTFRLPRDTEEPPRWPLLLLQGIGHHVLSTREGLDSGHLIDLGGPLVPHDVAPDGCLEGVVCVPDPQLAKLGTPHGSVLFLLLVGLARVELEAMQSWEMRRKVELVREVEPHGVTDPRRLAWPADPTLAPVYRRYALNVLVGA